MKKLFSEFREFISRGNVIDLAVAMAVGTAFTAIVKSLVDDIIMPVVGSLLAGIDFSQLKLVLPSAAGVEPATLNYGNFINAIINFLIIALCLFLVIKGMNTAHKRFARKKAEEIKSGEEEVASLSGEEILLKEILDELRQKNGSKK